MPVERLVVKCLRLICSILDCSRRFPRRDNLKRLSEIIFKQLPSAPSDLLPIVFDGLNSKQLVAVEKAAHAQGCRFATEPLWHKLCVQEFHVSEKASCDSTWRMTYEAMRRTEALRREREWLEEELEEMNITQEEYAQAKEELVEKLEKYGEIINVYDITINDGPTDHTGEVTFKFKMTEE